MTLPRAYGEGSGGGGGPATTDDLPEGSSNLYFTNARADARIANSVGSVTQGYDADTAAIAALAGVGIAVRTAANTWALRTILQPAAGISIANGDGVAGNVSFSLANDLAALEGLGSTGFAVRTAADTWAQRSIAGTAGQLSVANGDGVAGNPTVSLPSDVLFPAVATIPQNGLHLLDTDASHDLIVVPGSNLSADRTLSIVTGDANRTLTLNGNTTLSGTNTGDQTITLTGDVTGSGTGSFAVALAQALISQFAGGRLTLESGVPVSTSDQSAKTTIYYTPYVSNRIGLYTGSLWEILTFSEVSLSLSGFTANKNYDIFGYNNAGTLALEALVWTDDTTRATATVMQDGVLVRSGSTTRRYLGTIRIGGTTGQCSLLFGGIASGGSAAVVGIWNQNNRVPVRCFVGDSTDTWTYNSTTYRSSNNSTSMRVSFVSGQVYDGFTSQFQQLLIPSVGVASIFNAIGLDSTTAFSSRCAPGAVGQGANQSANGVATLASNGVLGFHFLQALEAAGTANNVTFVGDAGAPGLVQNGLTYQGMY